MSDNKKQLKKIKNSRYDDIVDGLSAVSLIFILTAGLYLWLNSMTY